MNARTLQALLDKQEISEVTGPRYARALDWLDIEMLKSCFHTDAQVDYGFFRGDAAQWCDTIISSLKESIHRFHYVFNTQIFLHGDSADVESNSLSGSRQKCVETSENFEEQRFFGSRYLDRLDRRDGIWKLSSRIVQIDFMQVMPADALPPAKLRGLPFTTNANMMHPLYRPLYNPT